MTLTLPNLDESLMQKLQQWAHQHGRSVEAEATDILSSVVGTKEMTGEPHSAEKPKANICDSIRGKWKGLGTTDETMRELRGED